MVSRCYRSVCKALLERVKEQKLGTKNPHLIVAVEKAVYQIEYCATILSDFEEYTGMEHMSNNIVAGQRKEQYPGGHETVRVPHSTLQG